MILLPVQVGINFHGEEKIFLGNWCLDYSMPMLRDQSDIKVIAHRWESFEVLERDYFYLSELYERVLDSISATLNTYHGIKKSNRYWRILLGPWLDTHITVYFDRWFSIKNAFEQYEIKKIIVSGGDISRLVPFDSLDYISMASKEELNLSIYSEIINYLGCGSEGLEFIAYTPDKFLASKSNSATNDHHHKKSLKREVYEAISRLILPFLSEERYLIVSSYLTKRNEVNLNLKLKQFPYIYRHSVSLPKTSVDRTLRLEIKLASFTPANDFEKALSDCLMNYIPIIFLEGFCAMSSETTKLPYPKSPKAIFSSSSLIFDELTKIYAAEAAERGVKIIYGQHGGHGVPKFLRWEDHEKAFSDRFLTWGWSDSCNKTFPVGFIKSGNVIKKLRSSGSELLMVRGLWPRYKFRIDSGAGLNQEHVIEECISLANLLPKSIKNNLLVRLYSEDYGFKEEVRWRDLCPDAKIQPASEKIQSLINRSKMVIYTYNASTGWMEYMAANVPVILFWNIESSPVREEAERVFKVFRSVGIFHDSPESAAAHISSVWHEVDKWWDSLEVMNARSLFHEKYCNTQLDVVNEIKKNILESCR